MKIRRVLATALVVAATASLARSQDCSIVGQNTFVREKLDDFYLWYRELPSANPALYESPEAYLDAVRFRPVDDAFSFISTSATTTAFYSNSQFIGAGFTQKLLGIDELRIAQVYPASPAAEAGLERGDYLLAVNGRPVSELLATGELGAELGPSTIGHVIDLRWRRFHGGELSARVTKRLVTIPTVSHSVVIDNDGLPIGYVHLRNFVEPSIPELDRVFADFRARGVVDVVLDLRYNGGGLVDVALHLASLIGGVRTNTQVFAEYVHNDKQSSRNSQVRFIDPPAAIDVPRVVVITSESSASASELVVNGLEPFIPTTLVGRRTYGKPVGQYGFDFCDKVLFPVSFMTVNAAGSGEYYSGLPVDCPMRDGLNRPLGHPEEARLAEAIYFLRNGSCSPASAESLRNQKAAPARTLEPFGLDQIINAR